MRAFVSLAMFVVCAAAFCQCVHTAKPHVTDAALMAKWEARALDKTRLFDRDLAGASLHELTLIRGLIFGRHGRVFKEQEIQNYLDSRPWYESNDSFENDDLNDIERANLDKVRLAEAAKHKGVEPGDLRLWENKAIPTAKLQNATVLDDHVMRLEVEAIHGRTFPEEPSMQTYFEARYWYKPDASYNSRVLNKFERLNIATLSAAERSRGGKGIRPEDVPAFQNKPLPAGALERTSLRDLRLLRNGFYALQGRKFHTSWISDFLETQDWYKPVDDPKPLTLMEHDNILKVVERERQIHEGLSTKPVTKGLVDGLLLEDVRNLKDEIYARHGRVFKTKWLQSYFASLPWYKANPDYSDSMLNPIEQKNIAYLAQVQKKLESQMSMEEG